MDVTINKAGRLVITLDFDVDGTPSSSGKSLVHASTRGNRTTELEVGGQNLVIGLNAYTKA